jgi:hypothetical protein
MRRFHKHLTFLCFALLSSALVAPVSAQQNKPLLDRGSFSIGAGISDNSVDRADETGFQIFGAYDLDQVNVMEGVQSSVEFGLMDYGFPNDSTGIWGTYVAEGLISEQLNWLARAGLDIGDDNGLMLGAGLSLAVDKKSKLRFEYVIRDDVDSLQINFLYHM